MIEGFAPVVDENARLLILGSMPSEESLRKGQYYGHPRNHLWPLLFRLFERELPNDYGQRLQLLSEQGIALWDVLARCQRRGSLDANIREEEANDFAAFYEQYPAIRTVLFNGAKAEAMYRKLVGLDEGKSYVRLPSSSPVPTAIFRKMEDKLAAWRIVTER